MTAVFLQFVYLWAIVFWLYTSGWLLFRADRNRTTRALARCQLLIILWCLPQMCLFLPLSREMKYGLYSISYIGIAFIGPSWLLFSFVYCQRFVGTAVKWVLYGISAVVYLLFATNEMHHLFYRVFTVEQVVYGPVFYGHMLYTYGCVLLGIGIVLKNFQKKQVAAVHMLVIILAAAVPLFFNLLYLSGIVNTDFDLTPPSFALSSILMMAAVFRYDFLDVNVLATDHIFASIAEGVIVYNKREMITYCNQAAQNWLAVEAGQTGEVLVERLNQWAEPEKNGSKTAENSSAVQSLIEKKERTGNPKADSGDENIWERIGRMDNRLLFLRTGEKLRLKHYLLHNKRGAVLAGVILLTDVQEYFELLRQNRELAVSEQRLAIEQERNRIAQDVHDTTGHTLTMIQSLIRLTRMAYAGEKENREEMRGEDYLSQAQDLASQGIKELRWSINHLRQGREDELVTESIFQLVRSVKEIEIEVEIQGEDGPAYSHLSSTVYRCLREAITNCLNYADASHMDVIVKFAGEELCLYIFDNGKGCASIQEHQGIYGIKERTRQAGGEARFFSAEGEGFQIYVKLPVQQPWGEQLH